MARKTKTAFAALATAWIALVFGPGVAGAQNAALIKRGQTLFNHRGCNICHGVGKQNAAPDLKGVTQRRSKEWITKWLKETDTMLTSDSVAMGMLAEYRNQKMPKFKLNAPEIEALIAFIDSRSE
jgi:mono/diheme cytochrome c family protein